MITTDDAQIEEKCRVIRQHGMRKRYYHDELGFNFRMTDVHAAIGLAQLKKLDQFNERRRKNAAFLTENLKGVITPLVPENQTHVYHQYTIRVGGGLRDELRDHLQANGVGSEVYYPVPIHQQTFYQKELGYRDRLPETELAAQEVLSLPVHPGLTASDLDTIVSEVNQFMVEHEKSR
jgi:dTDP-4-amino-4,6-dideoxygalactose transaminase